MNDLARFLYQRDLGLLLLRVFGALFGVEMLVATFIIGFSRGLGIEFYLAMVSFAIALMGSGRFSIYPAECLECGALVCEVH